MPFLPPNQHCQSTEGNYLVALNTSTGYTKTALVHRKIKPIATVMSVPNLWAPRYDPCSLSIYVYTLSITLLEIVEIVEIYWKFTKSAGNFLV